MIPTNHPTLPHLDGQDRLRAAEQRRLVKLAREARKEQRGIEALTRATAEAEAAAPKKVGLRRRAMLRLGF